MMKTLAALLALSAASTVLADNYVTYEAKDGPGKGKHIVLLAGDEEYRSEEAMPMLGKLLSQRHGFKCTVLFSVDDDGTINPNNGGSLSHPESLDSADAIIMLIRFRHWSNEAMKHFRNAVNRGIPIIALRTATHAFSLAKDSPDLDWTWNNKEGGFGRIVLGETWVSHWGKHRAEATKGIIEASAANHPILRGVSDVFGTTDVYEAHPPADATVLVRGQVLKGMTPDSGAADYKKKNKAGTEQGVNDPMMPIVWTREAKTPNGGTNKVLCSTIGAASDLVNEDLRRVLVNGVYWGLGLEVPAKTDVTPVGEFKPTMYGTKDSTDLSDPYGFRGFKKGVKPSDHALK